MGQSRPGILRSRSAPDWVSAGGTCAAELFNGPAHLARVCLFVDTNVSHIIKLF